MHIFLWTTLLFFHYIELLTYMFTSIYLVFKSTIWNFMPECKIFSKAVSPGKLFWNTDFIRAAFSFYFRRSYTFYNTKLLSRVCDSPAESFHKDTSFLLTLHVVGIYKIFGLVIYRVDWLGPWNLPYCQNCQHLIFL